MANDKIKKHARTHDVRLWQVAEGLGITDSCFSRKLRREFDEAETDRVLELIDRIAEREETVDGK